MVVAAVADAAVIRTATSRRATVVRPDARVALGVAAVGALGFLGGGPWLGAWIWLALWAPAAGWIAGSRVGVAWCLAPPVAWCAGLVLAGSALPSPLYGALAVAALFAGGAALGGVSRVRGPGLSGTVAGAALLLFGGGLLTALPALGGAAGRPLEPGRVAQLLDISPVVWVCESAGLDWMRHASVYEVAGAGDLGPEQRAPHGGPGVPLVVLVGALALALALGRRRPQAPES